MRFVYFGFDGFDQLPNNESVYECLDEETDELTTSIRVKDCDQRIKNVFLGWSSIFYLTENGNLIQSGYNSSGTNPLICTLDCKATIINVVCGWNCTFVVTDDGRCLQWKNQDYSSSPIPLKNQPESLFITDVATEDLQTVILGKDGALYDFSDDKIEKLPFCSAVNLVCCGKEHVVLLTTDAKVFTYGLGSRGQLGHGTVESEATPRVVEALEGIAIQTIAAGGWHSVAVSVIGDVYTWGWNESGQLGLLSTHTDESHSKAVITQAVPQLLDFPNDCIIKSVACGSRHTAAVSVEGELWMWGWNEYNQLGSEFMDENIIDHPVQVQLLNKPKVKDVICHNWSTIVIFDDDK